MYEGLKVVLWQLHEESSPREARLKVGFVVYGFVVFTITLIAGKLQLRFASGLIFGFERVEPH